MKPPATGAGSPAPPSLTTPTNRRARTRTAPKATSAEEAAFLALGPGAASWLIEAGAAGVRRIKAKMAEAVALSKLYSAAEIDRALGTAAVTGRFAEKDLLSILDYQAVHEQAEPARRSENHSLQPGTSTRSTFGIPTTSDVTDVSEGENKMAVDTHTTPAGRPRDRGRTGTPHRRCPVCPVSLGALKAPPT
ncbi:hypothetical protein GCM10017771_97480 [Streptomyces capitiformicae]|uniref:Uncharacterized protein n=1 Tax=Streptomyces capitiformicae TaxID=2014920 RepID=A0A919DSV9_9ACTN|nr:hypothetical protein GCM10017771_97480 [Streptomyces capitiformicae]